MVAFGDIDYSQQLQDNLYSATNLRGNHWGALPGTAREMEIVGNCLSGKPDSDVAIYTKDKATERQFMDYDGKRLICSILRHMGFIMMIWTGSPITNI